LVDRVKEKKREGGKKRLILSERRKVLSSSASITSKTFNNLKQLETTTQDNK